MGTYLSSYAVDLAKLTAAWGSNDKALLRRATKVGDIEGNRSWFADRIEDGAPTLDQAIAEVLAGTITKREHAFQYVYAIEALCRALGAAVGDELKVGEWIESQLDPLLKQVKSKDFCRIMKLHAPVPPLAIPEPKEYPFCSALALDEVNAILGSFSRIEVRLKSSPIEDDDVRENLEFALPEIRSRLTGATRRRRGLVNFLY